VAEAAPSLTIKMEFPGLRQLYDNPRAVPIAIEAVIWFAIAILKIAIFGNMEVMTKAPDHRDLFPGALEMMILHSLRIKPMHGYALVKHIQQVADGLLQIEEGSLYPALQRMLKEGWLESEAGVSLKGRPTRIYRLSRSGRKHLEKEVSSFEKMFAGITRVLATAKG